MSGPSAEISDLASGLALAPVALGSRTVGVMRIDVKQPQILQLGNGGDTLQWSAAGDVAAAHDPSGAMLATGTALWLVDGAAHQVTAAPVDLTGATLRMNLAAGQRLALPLPPAAEPALWQVLGQGGQPGVAIGDDGVMAVGAAQGALSQAVAFQPAGVAAPVLRLWQAGTPIDTLPLTVQRTGFASVGTLALAAGDDDGTLPAQGALQAGLAPGWKRLALDLPAGAAAVLSRNGQTERLILGDGVVPDVLDSDADSLMLLNSGQAAAFSVSMQAETAPQLVMPADGLRTYYSATPANLHVIVPNGGKVQIAGAAAAVTGIGGDGMVSRGMSANVSAGGAALLAVQPGLSVVSQPVPMNMPGQLVAVPGSAALSGQSMMLNFAAGEARLIHFETDTPVVVVSGDGPQLFPAGARLSLFQPKGKTQGLRLQAVTPAGLSGMARFEAVDAVPMSDGLGVKVRIAPGQSRLFSFSLDAPRSIGVGVRGSVDDANCRLLAADGSVLGQGVIAMNQLPAGTYFLQADVPANAAATDVQPALVGKTLPDDGPPPDVQASYRE